VQIFFEVDRLFFGTHMRYRYYVPQGPEELALFAKMNIYTGCCTSVFDALFCEVSDDNRLRFIMEDGTFGPAHGIKRVAPTFKEEIDSAYICLINSKIGLETIIYMGCACSFTEANGGKLESLFKNVHPFVLSHVTVDSNCIFVNCLTRWIKGLTPSPVRARALITKLRKHKCTQMDQLCAYLKELRLPLFLSCFFASFPHLNKVPHEHMMKIASNHIFFSMNMKAMYDIFYDHIIACEDVDMYQSESKTVYNFQDPFCVEKWESMRYGDETGVTNGAGYDGTVEVEDCVLDVGNYIPLPHVPMFKVEKPPRKTYHAKTTTTPRLPDLQNDGLCTPPVLCQVTQETDEVAKILSGLNRNFVRDYRLFWQRRTAMLSLLEESLPVIRVYRHNPQLARLYNHMYAEMMAVQKTLEQCKRMLVKHVKP
jgi:hypothetical protein